MDDPRLNKVMQGYAALYKDKLEAASVPATGEEMTKRVRKADKPMTVERTEKKLKKWKKRFKKARKTMSALDQVRSEKGSTC